MNSRTLGEADANSGGLKPLLSLVAFLRLRAVFLLPSSIKCTKLKLCFY